MKTFLLHVSFASQQLYILASKASNFGTEQHIRGFALSSNGGSAGFQIACSAHLGLM